MSEEIQDISKELKSLLTEHSYYKRYEESSVVTHTTGDSINFYKATKNVPRYISINNKSYWKKLNKKTDDGESPEPTPGGKPNFYLIPPYTIEGIQYPSYMYGENSITILYPMFQYDADDISNLLDIKNMKIGNETYLVEFNGTDDPQPGIAYVPDGGSNVLELTPEIIEEYAAIGINLNLDNGHYVCVCAFAYLSDETPHGDLTATFYDSNGNGNSITIVEHT